MKLRWLVWGRHLDNRGFELHDWDYRWYGIQTWSWGIGIAIKTRKPAPVPQEDQSYTVPGFKIHAPEDSPLE